MAKKDKQDESSEAEMASEVVVKKKQERIGILLKGFVQSLPLGPHSHQCVYKKWSAGQIITNPKDIEMLIGLNAPMGVYIKDVDGTAKN